MRKIALLIPFLCCCFYLIAAPYSDSTQSPQPQRKKVGIVFGGGGAKGVAHIGVLKVLEEAGIPIDYIAGTSMGAIVGGLYAIGYSPKALDSIMRAQDWMALLSDRTTRTNKLFTEKEISDRTLITVPFNRKRFEISTGILSGNAVMNMLSQFTTGYHYTKSFDELPIPFACIAYDLKTGEEVVMREGNLALAIRASMSIPGAFSTIEREGRILIDGGVINNFPVDVIRAMGADVVIGIDVNKINGSEETESEDDLPPLNSLSTIAREMMDRMGKEKLDANRKDADLFIHPNVSPYNTASFNAEAIDSLLLRGERVARENWDAIMAFKESLNMIPGEDEHTPASLRHGKDEPIGDSFPINEIYFEGINGLNPNNLQRMLHFKEHSRVSTLQMQSAIDRLKGTGLFHSVGYSMINNNDGYDLMFSCVPRSTSTVSLGVHFDTYDIAAGYLNVAFAPQKLGGAMVELKSRISSNIYGQIGFYYQDAWVGKFGLSYLFRHGDINVYTATDSTQINTRFNMHRVKLDLANFYYRNFNFYLNARYEFFNPITRLANSDKINLQGNRENLIIYSAGVNYDNFDNAYYPHTGIRFNMDYSLYTDNFASYKGSAPFSSITSSLFGAIPASNRLTIVPGGYFRILRGSLIPYSYQNYIGGPYQGMYMDHQMAFYGIKPTEIVDQKMLAACLEARYRIGGNHFVWVKANAIRISHTVLEMIEWDKGNFQAGGAIGYSYNSLFGPIDVMLDYGTQVGKKVGFYINFGKRF